MWHRWDPHLHAPGTVLNDQFSGDNPWEGYLQRIESSEPRIKALGVTDYASLELYESVKQFRNEGRIPQIELIFANVELRLATGTGRDSAINLHLLISPVQPDHVDQARRFLLGLTFHRKGEVYRCERDDLIRLGKAHDPTIENNVKALEVGTNQFKVTFEELRKLRNGSDWAKKNILIACAGGSSDGTSGLQNEKSFAALRKEIEAYSDIIFSAQPKQREFWLGYGAANTGQLTEGWGGCKPCIHGSDAHDLNSVGRPNLDRFCWLKGDLTFETLRQICLEPEYRSYIGATPPKGALASQIIESVSVNDAKWISGTSIPLNEGLVALIGARGSGKTALADIIAAGSNSGQWDNKRSFLYRAKELLAGSSVSITWADKHKETLLLEPEKGSEWPEPERTQYLSQQFVERLCSAEGMTDDLLDEIQRVIFQAHHADSRMGATSFSELLSLKAQRARNARVREETASKVTLEAVTEERGKRASLRGLQKKKQNLVVLIDADKKDREALMKPGQSGNDDRLSTVATALDFARGRLDNARRRHESLLALRESVEDIRQNLAPSKLRQLEEEHALAAFSPEQWQQFLLSFSGDVDAVLDAELKTADASEKLIKGKEVPHIAEGDLKRSRPLIELDADLFQLTTNLLDAELARLQGLSGIDAENTKKLKRLSAKITLAEAEINKLDAAIADAQKADGRIAELNSVRMLTYERIFAAIVEEERQLSTLYTPLQNRLKAESGSLGKLSFSVRRHVDVIKWAKAGEALLDLRKAGPFRHRGTLLSHIMAELEPAWRKGSPPEVRDAMQQFRVAHEAGILAHAPEATSCYEGKREWGQRVAEWLHSSDHISISYSVQYDGVEIEQLSPGTRGIVLLLLYLAIDQEDDRPLIIDQPEENLDPRSIFVELVEHFREAKFRRQIIIVTHNANLVVNTDADQVIVATCGPHAPGELPMLSYMSGGLENPVIREAVCEILEGGEAAFRERAKRLRVTLGSVNNSHW
jgi:energy-coupling factor transporter ATP-binding protein EcfA2